MDTFDGILTPPLEDLKASWTPTKTVIPLEDIGRDEQYNRSSFPVTQKELLKASNKASQKETRTRSDTNPERVFPRPVNLRLSGVNSLDVRGLNPTTRVYAIIQVIHRPFGPFAYQFTTTLSKDLQCPSWKETFFVPVFSSKYDVIVTIIGKKNMGGRDFFFGQASIRVKEGWESLETHFSPLGKYNFPVNIPLDQTHQFSQGTVRVHIVPSASPEWSLSGEVCLASSADSSIKRSISNVSSSIQRKIGKFSLRKGISYEKSLGLFRRIDSRQWCVLTDTNLCFYHLGSTIPCISLDLRHIQLMETPIHLLKQHNHNNQSSELLIKLYCKDIIYEFSSPTLDERNQWISRIKLARERLLQP